MEHNAKHFALQLGALITLYVSLTSLIVLLFSIINIFIPDAAADIWRTEQAASSARVSIATLIVFFPVFVWLTRTVNLSRRSGGVSYAGLTKWLIYLSLLVGGLVLLGNAVTTLYTFLNGELSLRFFLKAASLFVIVGTAFAYYLLDARGHWQTREKQSVQYGIAASIIVLAAIVTGFTQIETPTDVREARLDQRQLNDLRQVQWKVQEYLHVEETAPATLEDAFQDIIIPQAPDGRPAYEYRVTEQGFALCAWFSQPSHQISGPYYDYYDDRSVIKNPESWDHAAGTYCFERIVSIPSDS